MNLGQERRMLEYYSYHAFTEKKKLLSLNSERLLPVADILRLLPEDIIKELLPKPNRLCAIGLDIETSKTEIIKRLDRILSDKFRFSKARHIEVTKNEIDNYDYYFVDLKNIDWNKDIFYDFEKPSCSHETCPWGTKITSGITIADKIVDKYDFVKISGVWDQNVKFLISNRIKKLFNENCLTGLDYETCETQSSTKSESENNKYFIAKVTTSYKKTASDIILRDYCKQHSIIVDATPININYPYTKSQDDFQVIDRIVIGKNEYTLRSPWFFISRRTLKILLDNKVKDLRSMTLFTKNGFRAVPFD
jgi:hypothetical protein